MRFLALCVLSFRCVVGPWYADWFVRGEKRRTKITQLPSWSSTCSSDGSSGLQAIDCWKLKRNDVLCLCHFRSILRWLPSHRRCWDGWLGSLVSLARSATDSRKPKMHLTWMFSPVDWHSSCSVDGWIQRGFLFHWWFGSDFRQRNLLCNNFGERMFPGSQQDHSGY